MKFSLVDGNKVEATKGAKGVCPICGSELIAKCGEIRINHWAHKSKSDCDRWWESETEWHRSWKNNFPVEWQEFALSDEQTDERHIADVCTSHGLVIEFQHSYIGSQERTSRESFYKDMVWVVDGTRLKRDYTRFVKGIKYLHKAGKKGLYFLEDPDKCFPSTWVGSSVPVIFDFLGTESEGDCKTIRNQLYCLFPKSNTRKHVLAIFSRESFIKSIINGGCLREKQAPQNKSNKPATNTNISKKKASTHYLDRRKGKFVKRWRF